AIAAQETGHIWGRLNGVLSVAEILEICVGDTLDADKGRKAFPKTKDELVSAPRGDEMFTIAHDALVQMARHVPGFEAVSKRPNKFCHGYGIFQYDLQFFKKDPDYFLERQWRDFDAALAKCIEELRNAMARMGIAGQPTLTDLERVHVAIAYNAGSFKPAKGLKQGFFDGKKFYGEMVFEFMRLAQTVSIPSSPAVIAAPAPGTAPLAPPTPLTATGEIFEVDVKETPLRLRSEPRIDKAKPNSNVKVSLPDGHRVRLVSGKRSDEFLEVETSFNGAFFRGFAASKFLVPVTDGGASIPVVVPEAAPPATGIVAVFAPVKNGVVTKRTGIAGAHSLNEPGQPGRKGSTPSELVAELGAIVDYLAVDKASHRRYQPRPGVTFCNIYAHDYCHLAGAYLPRVWWTPDAIERLAQGVTVEPRLAATIDEQRANDLFRWLRAFGPRFGWRQTGTLTKLQTEANAGGVALIIARRKIDGKSGHVVIVPPETATESARRDASGEVIAPLQSQAGAANFRYGTGKLNWWASEEFAESAFWIHA
ncbi:MAG TPA: hypothetical protein VER03_18595, partial [Bryobacteraceae bacterium]|nr:hypothetical protein [Bryobacteraceae bacterium]